MSDNLSRIGTVDMSKGDTICSSPSISVREPSTSLVPYVGQTVVWEEYDITMSIIDADGNKYLTLKQLCDAMDRSERAMLKLIASLEKRREMRKGVHYLFTPLQTPGGMQETKIFSYRGIIRIAMRSTGERAEKFRDWAEDVLYELMTVGEVKLTDHPMVVDYEHQRYLANMSIWNQLWNDHPESAHWLLPRIDQFTQRELARTALPILGVTRLDEDLFKKLVLGQNWSPSAMQRAFRVDIGSKKQFDELCMKWNVPKWKTVSVPDPVILKMFRDFYQISSPLLSDMDGLILKYVKYSRESIRRGLNKLYTHFTAVLSDNQNPHVSRYNKSAYATYLASDIWNTKRHLYLYPSGPFESCWICNCHISLSTGHLHHLTYDRVGYEIFEDLWPLCPVCHKLVHKLDSVPQDVFTPGTVMTGTVMLKATGQIGVANYAVVPDARIIEKTKGGAFKIALPNGQHTCITRTSMHPDSEIQKVGDRGILKCIMSGLWEHVQIALRPWGQDKI